MRGREVVFIEYHGVPNLFLAKNIWSGRIKKWLRKYLQKNLLYCPLTLLKMCTMFEGTYSRKKNIS
jgi:hypothetical protein